MGEGPFALPFAAGALAELFSAGVEATVVAEAADEFVFAVLAPEAEPELLEKFCAV
jgi:hypothetical protein